MRVDTPSEADFSAAERQVARCRPADIKAPNHNDLRSFVHAWFAGFDHIAPAEFFLAHFDDADMTFNFGGQPLAHNHASFRAWFADALTHIPWDFHDVLDITVTGTHATGWQAEFFFRHVGEWRDSQDSKAVRPFNRVLRAHWRVEHNGERFIIRRYELSIAQNAIPL